MPHLITKAFTLLTIVVAVICLSIYLDIPPQVIFEFMARTHKASLHLDLSVQAQF